MVLSHAFCLDVILVSWFAMLCRVLHFEDLASKTGVLLGCVLDVTLILRIQILSQSPPDFAVPLQITWKYFLAVNPNMYSKTQRLHYITQPSAVLLRWWHDLNRQINHACDAGRHVVPSSSSRLNSSRCPKPMMMAHRVFSSHDPSNSTIDSDRTPVR